MTYGSSDSLIKLTIDYTKVADNLTDFPVFVNPQDIDTLTLAQAQGIRIYDSNMDEIPREIVSKDEMWFKAPSLSSSVDTDFYIELTGDADYDADDDYGKYNTWNSNYKAVYHFEGNANDSTSNGNNGTGYNMTYSGGAGVFNGSSSYINLGSTTQLKLQSQSIFGWIKTSVNNDGWLYTKKSIRDGGNNNGLNTGLYQSGALCARLKIGSGASFIDARYSANFYDNNRHYVGYTFSGTQTKVYMDGTLVGTNNTSATLYYNGDYPAFIGAESYNSSTMGSYFNGSMKGLGIYSGALSSDRISTEYANQSDPSSFYTIT